MEKNINEFKDLLLSTMTCKCRAMIEDTRCAHNLECDGECSMFKTILKKYINDIKREFLCL